MGSGKLIYGVHCNKRLIYLQPGTPRLVDHKREHPDVPPLCALNHAESSSKSRTLSPLPSVGHSTDTCRVSPLRKKHSVHASRLLLSRLLLAYNSCACTVSSLQTPLSSC